MSSNTFELQEISFLEEISTEKLTERWQNFYTQLNELFNNLPAFEDLTEEYKMQVNELQNEFEILIQDTSPKPVVEDEGSEAYENSLQIKTHFFLNQCNFDNFFDLHTNYLAYLIACRKADYDVSEKEKQAYQKHLYNNEFFTSMRSSLFFMYKNWNLIEQAIKAINLEETNETSAANSMYSMNV